MQIKTVQMLLLDTCDDVFSAIDKSKPEFLAMLEEHIDFSQLISAVF